MVETILIHQVMLRQQGHQLAAAVDKDAPAGLLFQPSHLLDDVAVDQR